MLVVIMAAKVADFSLILGEKNFPNGYIPIHEMICDFVDMDMPPNCTEHNPHACLF